MRLKKNAALNLIDTVMSDKFVYSLFWGADSDMGGAENMLSMHKKEKKEK